MTKEEQSPQETNNITPDMVQLITDKVYELWRKDLRVANERRQLQHKTTGCSTKAVR